MNACIDCKWAKPDWSDPDKKQQWLNASCLHPTSTSELDFGEETLIIGKPSVTHLFCRAARKDDGSLKHCGKDGKYFEKRPPSPIKVATATIWRKLRDLARPVRRSPQ